MTKATLAYQCTPDRVALGEPGGDNRVAMTFLVANRSAGEVPVEQITLTLPQGTADTDLLAPGSRFGAGSVHSSQPATAWTTSVAANQVVLLPVASDFCVLAPGDTLQFTLSGLCINAAGPNRTAQIAVAESLHDRGTRKGAIPVLKVQPDFHIQAFSADQTNVQPGAAVTVTWDVVGALSCSVTASVLDVVHPLVQVEPVCTGTLGTALSGSRTCGLQGPTVFTLTALGKGSDGGDVTLVSQLLATVNEPAIKLTVYPPDISKGQSATLRWIAADAGKLLLYTKPAQGQHTVTDLTATPAGTRASQLLVDTRYSLCAFTGANDADPAQEVELEVTVEQPQWQAPPSASGAPTPAFPGDTVTLAWAVLNVDHCRITCNLPGFDMIDGLPPAGTKAVTLPDPGVADGTAFFTVTPVQLAGLGDFTPMTVAVPVTNTPCFVHALVGPPADVPSGGSIAFTWQVEHADTATITSNLPQAVPQSVDPGSGQASVPMPDLVIPTPIDYTLEVWRQGRTYTNSSTTTVGCAGQATTQWCKSSKAGDEQFDYLYLLNFQSPGQGIARVDILLDPDIGITALVFAYGADTNPRYALPDNYIPQGPTSVASLTLAPGDYLVALDAVFGTDGMGGPPTLWYLKLSTAQGQSVANGTQTPPGPADPPCHISAPAGQQIIALSWISNNDGSGGPFAGLGAVCVTSSYGQLRADVAPATTACAQTSLPAANGVPPHRVLRLPAALFAPILDELEAYGRAFPWDIDADLAGTCAHDEADRHVGLEALQAAMREPVTHHHAKDKRNIRLRDDRVATMAARIREHLATSGIAPTASMSGKMIYPPGGWMGWHTNADRPGWRLYVNYVHEGGRSSFRWWDGAAIRSDPDRRGLNFRLFRVHTEPLPLWHCVHAGEWRLSMGFSFDEVAPFALQSALDAGTAGPGDR